jgi:hypothetical protein
MLPRGGPPKRGNRGFRVSVISNEIMKKGAIFRRNAGKVDRLEVFYVPSQALSQRAKAEDSLFPTQENPPSSEQSSADFFFCASALPGLSYRFQDVASQFASPPSGADPIVACTLISGGS